MFTTANRVGCRWSYYQGRGYYIIFPGVSSSKLFFYLEIALVSAEQSRAYSVRTAVLMTSMLGEIYDIIIWWPFPVVVVTRTLLSRWLLKGGMTVGTVMPRLLSSVGGMSLMSKTCSDEERALFSSPATAEVGEIANVNVTLVRLYEAI